jgi:hypothetical protein
MSDASQALLENQRYVGRLEDKGWDITSKLSEEESTKESIVKAVETGVPFVIQIERWLLC